MTTIQHQDEFTVDIEGDTTGDKFIGKFTVRTRFSFRDMLDRDVVSRSILGVNADNASPLAVNLATILAEMSMRVISAPSWWSNAGNGQDLSDQNVLLDVYNKALACEAKSVESVKKKGEVAKDQIQKA